MTKARTKIPYVTETWEVTGGCTKCSVGCQNCYAIPLIGNRLSNNPVCKGRYKDLVKDKDWTGKIKLFEDRLDQPLHWKEPRTIFVCPRSDLFHPAVPFEFVDKMFAVIWELNCRQIWHTLLVLTKRPQRMLDYHNSRPWPRVATIIKEKYGRNWAGGRLAYPEHLYFGATICNQAEADKNIPILLQIPAAKRWLSIEPMLGPVDLRDIHIDILNEIGGRYTTVDCLDKWFCHDTPFKGAINWVVVGCESGPNRRPCELKWMIDIVEQCQAAGVPVFVKQVSIDGRVSHKMDEWPEELRVRDKI